MGTILRGSGGIGGASCDFFFQTLGAKAIVPFRRVAAQGRQVIAPASTGLRIAAKGLEAFAANFSLNHSQKIAEIRWNGLKLILSLLSRECHDPQGRHLRPSLAIIQRMMFKSALRSSMVVNGK